MNRKWFRSIAEEWARCEAKLLANGVRRKSLKSLRAMFYAGYWAMFLNWRVVVDAPQPEVDQFLAERQRELEDYMRKLKAGD